jgi:aminopeptidase
VDALEKNLEKLAELAVRVGLNLEEGQEVIATAPIEAVDFVRLLAEKAYAQGASLFTVLYGDNVLSRKRLSLAPEAGLDRAPRLALRGHGQGLPRGGGPPGGERQRPQGLRGPSP